MTSAIFKSVPAAQIGLVGGEGAWLHAADGRQILDSCGGVAVSSLGHRHPRMREAMALAAENVAWAHAGSFTCEPVEELAEFLVSRSGGLTHAQFLSGGSEAIEVALKVAVQYHQERGDTERRVFIARHQGYHGSTFGALSVSGNPGRRSIFEHLLPPAVFVEPCYQYRGQLPGETDDGYVRRLAEELETTILKLSPSRVAAFVAEPVVGSTNGAVPPVPGYFRAMREVCSRHGVLLVLDDVMSGLGRCGAMFTHLDEGMTPDIVAIGKGLAAGYQPISAYLAAPHIVDAIARGSGVLRNGQTHVNHPFACAVALAAQKIVAEDDLIDQARRRGMEMKALLAAALADHPHVGDIRGRGLLLGVEFVADKASKAPLTGGGEFVARFKAAALEHGLLTYPGSGTADGVLGNHVLFAPPFVSTAQNIEEMVERFVHTLEGMSPFLASLERTSARISRKVTGW